MDVYAFEPLGFEGFLVKVEVDIRRGIPAVDIVGLAAASVRESRERVRAAIRNSQFQFPLDRVLINLSPADLPKEGSLYDLPIALKILAVSGALPDLTHAVLAAGELTLDGSINPVRGVLPAVLQARRHGVKMCIVPAGNCGEVEQVAGLSVYRAQSLREVFEIFAMLRADQEPAQKCLPREAAGVSFCRGHAFGPDFSDYVGGEKLVRALIVAAAGRHNVLLFGPPGSGKTMAALRFPSLLPDLDEAQWMETSALLSLFGARGFEADPRRRPPFRAPHHSASLEGMVGGGRTASPGEICLAHNGVLFLDETPEFRHDVLQSLREPLEKGSVNLVRAGRSLRYPADFQLVAAANPCPCGYLGSVSKTCICSPSDIQRYWKRLGGPLLDRMDIRIPVKGPSVSEVVAPDRKDQQQFVSMILAARARQMRRSMASGKAHGAVYNSRLAPGEILERCSMENEARDAFKSGADELSLSIRACHSVLKLALTISDIDGKEKIDAASIQEAVEYRRYGEGDSFWPD